MTDELDVLTGADWIETTVGVRLRSDLAVLDVSGDDQRTWLNGQISNDVRTTKLGDAVYGLVLNVRGKIVSDLWALDRGDGFSLVVPRRHIDALRTHLEQYIIMEDVSLAVREDAAVISVQGPRSGDVIRGVPTRQAFPCDELGSGGDYLLCTTDEAPALLSDLYARATALGGGAVDDAAFETARVRRGVPRVDQDFDIHHYPQEAGLKQRAVSFSKGCYLGQEVVCTLESRGKLSRKLVSLRFAGAAPVVGESILTTAGDESGTITSVAVDRDGGHGLGYVRRIHIEPPQALRTGGGIPLTVEGIVGHD